MVDEAPRQTAFRHRKQSHSTNGFWGSLCATGHSAWVDGVHCRGIKLSRSLKPRTDSSFGLYCVALKRRLRWLTKHSDFQYFLFDYTIHQSTPSPSLQRYPVLEILRSVLHLYGPEQPVFLVTSFAVEAHVSPHKHPRSTVAECALYISHSSAMHDLDPLVSEFQHEHHRPRQAEALQALRKIASLVKPIMRQRNWRVGTLCEFYPEQSNLLGLNVNRGQKICLRLRYPGDERQFLPIEQVTDTMLHELCHNVHGPHNEQFHALWNQLRDEHEALVRKGYTGEGFLSNGKRLGGSRIPMQQASRRATAAPDRRKQLTAGSGQKLGGAPVLRGTDIRKVIADAAQRRIDITRGCASNTDTGNKLARDVENNHNGFRTKAEEDDANERAIMQAYIELIQEEEKQKYGDSYVPPSEENPSGMRSPPPIPTSSKPPPPPSTTPQKRPPVSIDLTSTPSPPTRKQSPPPEEPPLDTWTCPTCTLINPLHFLTCDACLSERPPNTNPTSSASSSRHPTPNGTSSVGTRTARETPNALKPRLKATEALKRFEAIEREKQAVKPVGWLCNNCGNFMEQQWWTCANCGTMKTSS